MQSIKSNFTILIGAVRQDGFPKYWTDIKNGRSENKNLHILKNVSLFILQVLWNTRVSVHIWYTLEGCISEIQRVRPTGEF